MTAKPVAPRQAAREDIRAAVQYYAREAGEAVSLSFVDAVRSTFAAIGRRPSAGFPQIGAMIGLAALRSHRLGRFPYLVFYVERDDHIDVWRVLHVRRDLVALLREP